MIVWKTIEVNKKKFGIALTLFGIWFFITAVATLTNIWAGIIFGVSVAFVMVGLFLKE